MEILEDRAAISLCQFECHHHGHCVQRASGFSCKCRLGFIGDFCEQIAPNDVRGSTDVTPLASDDGTVVLWLLLLLGISCAIISVGVYCYWRRHSGHSIIGKMEEALPRISVIRRVSQWIWND